MIVDGAVFIPDFAIERDKLRLILFFTPSDYCYCPVRIAAAE